MGKHPPVRQEAPTYPALKPHPEYHTLRALLVNGGNRHGALALRHARAYNTNAIPIDALDNHINFNFNSITHHTKGPHDRMKKKNPPTGPPHFPFTATKHKEQKREKNRKKITKQKRATPVSRNPMARYSPFPLYTLSSHPRTAEGLASPH